MGKSQLQEEGLTTGLALRVVLLLLSLLLGEISNTAQQVPAIHLGSTRIDLNFVSFCEMEGQLPPFPKCLRDVSGPEGRREKELPLMHFKSADFLWGGHLLS